MHTAEEHNPIDEQAIDWFVRLRDQECSEQDRQTFDAWLAADPRHRQAWADVQRLWQGMDQLPARQPARPAKAARRGRLAVAASVLLMLGGLSGLWAIQPEGVVSAWRADYRTATAMQASHELPDGSQVTLAAGSAFSLDFSDQQRRLTLHRGELFVNVRPDSRRPFVVSTAHGDTRVLGTRFNVKRSTEDTLVELASGSVQVRSASSHESRVLQPGEGIRYSADRLGRVFAVDTQDIALWQQQRLLFQSAPLREVLEDLDRHRPGRILVSDAIANLPVTGVFNAQNPDNALDTITNTLPVRRIDITPWLVLIQPR